MTSSSSSSHPDTRGWVIFLDVDGVLLPVTRYSFGGGELDPVCVKRLEHLVQFLQSGGGKSSSQEANVLPETVDNASQALSVGVEGEEKVEKREVEAEGHPCSEPTCPVTLILSSTWRNYPDMVARLNHFFIRHCHVHSDTADSPKTKDTHRDPQAIPRAMPHFPLVSGGVPNGTVLVSSVLYYPDNPSEQRLVRDRVDEIYAWIHEHVETYPEAIGGRWLAIDDMKLDVDDRMKGHFLYTSTEIGLQDEDVAKAKEWIRDGLPSVAHAREAAVAARVSPALLNEKVAIERVLRERLEVQLEAAVKETEEKERRLKEATEALRQREIELKALQRKHDDVAYRLAVLDFSAKKPLLKELVEYASKITGKEKREADQQISAYVRLLMREKEIQNAIRKERRKRGMGKGKKAEEEEEEANQSSLASETNNPSTTDKGNESV